MSHEQQGRSSEALPDGERRFRELAESLQRKAPEQALRESRDEIERSVERRTADLRQRARQLSRLVSELTLAEQRERHRLSQLLHDHLQQMLVSARLNLDALEGVAREPTQVGGRSIRVLLVDDHEVIRQGLCTLLSAEGDIDVVGEASDGLSGVEQARALRPDIVLMDFSMPRMNGVEATRRIAAEVPQVKIIGLSMYEQRDQQAAMTEAGASAYVTKSDASSTLLETIRSVAQASAAAS